MAIFVKITQNKYVKERNPLSKAIISLLGDNWNTVRDRMSVSIIH